jgi:hypothetical protein
MKYVIFNKETGEVLRAPAKSVGMWISNYKTESAAKAALTRLLKKNARRVEVHALYNKLDSTGLNFHVLMDKLKAAGCTQREAYNASSKIELLVREDYKIATAEAFREEHPVKMVTRRNMMSGKEYQEAENTPGYLSPASEAYWSM